MNGRAYRSVGHEEAGDAAASASVRLGPAPIPEMLRHPWTGTRDQAAEEIAFIRRQLEDIRAAMIMLDPETHRTAAREELRSRVQTLSPRPVT